MARIAIAEPQGEIRELIARVVSALGHVAVDPRGHEPDDDLTADVLLLEPADDEALQLAHRLRSEQPELPLIMISIRTLTSQTRALNPIAFLQKPFGVTDLEDAIVRALDRSRG